MNQIHSNLADFMQDVDKLHAEIVSLRDRLALVDENKDKVRPKIYEKVRSDYEKNLSVLFEQLSPFKEKIDSEIEKLTVAIAELTERFEAREEELEELELRFLAGEFDPDAYEPKQSEFKTEMDELQSQISDRNAAIEAYQKKLRIIAGEPVDEEPVDEEPPIEEMGESSQEQQGYAADVIDDSYQQDPLTAFESTAAETEEVIDTDFGTADPIMTEVAQPAPEEYDEMNEEYEYTADSAQKLYEDTPMDETLGVAQDSVKELASTEAEAAGEDYIWTTTPVLDVIEGDFAGESYPMDKERITIGRGPNNDIQLATDTSVSRHHAQITNENDRYVVVDLESSNGTSVNGIRITRSYLRPNDEVMIGQSKLVIRPS